MGSHSCPVSATGMMTSVNTLCLLLISSVRSARFVNDETFDLHGTLDQASLQALTCNKIDSVYSVCTFHRQQFHLQCIRRVCSELHHNSQVTEVMDGGRPATNARVCC